MKKLLIALAAAFVAVASYGQGQVVFANKVGTAVDAPVTLSSDPTKGPGPSYTAQLFLKNTDGSLTSLGTSAFRAAGTGAAAIADRYWVNQTLDVPVAAGANATFVVRAWQTSLGSFDAAKASGSGYGESAAFTTAVGGGQLPPTNLTGLTAFTVTVGAVPEPSIIALGVLGAGALFLRRRK